MALVQSEKNGSFLTFDTDKHSYTLNGIHVPGVTTFIKGGLPESAMLTSWKIGQGAEFVWDHCADKGVDQSLKKEVLKNAKTAYTVRAQQAAAIGSMVHDYAYHFELNNHEEVKKILARANEHKDKEKILNGISKFEDWQKRNSDTLVASEEIVASVKHSFGGKYDRLASRNGLLVLSDFKTSNGFYVDQFIQLAAYVLAIEEWTDRRVSIIEILRFGKEDGKFETHVVDSRATIDEYIHQAVRCKQTYDFKNFWEKQKPFKVDYARSTKKTK